MMKLPGSAVAWALAIILGTPGAHGACCYFSAKDKDVNQPAQKAFITWEPREDLESFTVQPKFEGNAKDFGMVIPTPSRPKLNEMPRELFKELAVFTVLEPIDMSKYKLNRPRGGGSGFGGGGRGGGGVFPAARPQVRVVEVSVVGSLEYKVVEAKNAKDLFDWLKENDYSYAGDEETLDHYVKKGWYFTAMKVDPSQMKTRPDGSYEGEVTPTRFTFSSSKLVYPLRITRISVKDKTEALFYVQAPYKMDLPDAYSHQPSFLTMWSTAMGFAIPERMTREETMWQRALEGSVPAFQKQVNAVREKKHEPATLEWAKKINDDDVRVMTGQKKYNRDAPAEDVEKLRQLKGIVKTGQWVTKMRKVFAKDEMTDDLVFEDAKVDDKRDDIEYFSILPTSPP